MLTPFNELPDAARVWIYQSPRFFSEQEVASIEAEAAEFISTWEAHKQPLRAGAKMFHNAVLVFAIDEGFNPVSGCGIDKSVDFARKASVKYHTDFFDRMTVAAVLPEGISLFNIPELKQAIAEGRIGADTPYLDQLVPYLGDLRRHWEKPMANGWMSRYLPDTSPAH